MLKSKPEERRKVGMAHGGCSVMKTQNEQMKAKGK
jgi:hypothetical protein